MLNNKENIKLLVKDKNIMQHYFKFIILVSHVLLSLLFFPSMTFAINPIVENIDPGRIHLEKSQPIEPTLKPDETEAQDKTKQTPHIPTKQGKTFLLKQIKLVGNTIISNDELLPLFKAKLNTQASFIELREIAEKITAQYRNAGYVLTKAIIPPQKVENGIVLYSIIEGYIDDIEIQGETTPQITKHLLAFAKRLLNSKPFKITELERYSLLINDLPGIKAKTFISPKKEPSTIGTAKLIVLIDKNIMSMSANYNNQASENYGSTQFTTAGYLNNPNLLEKTSITLQASTLFKRMHAYYITKEFYAFNNGFKLSFGGQLVKTNPFFKEQIINDCNIHGNSFTANISGTYPVIRAFRKNWFITLTTDIANINSFANTNGPNFMFMDKIRALRLSSTYEFTDTHLGSNLIFLQTSQGLNILGATKASNNSSLLRRERRSKPAGKSNFTKFNVSISRLQFTKSVFSILFSTTGQYSLQSLLSSEKYGFGGSQLGRGYTSTAIDGDHGLAGLIEPRYDFYLKNKLIPKIQLFSSYELGLTWNKNTPQSQDIQNKQSAATATIGIRTIVSKYLSAQFMWAKPLTRVNGAENKPLRTFINISLNI